MDVVHRRRQHAVADGEDAHHRLDRARGTEAVAGHGLRRGDREPVRVVAEDLLDRAVSAASPSGVEVPWR
jgi:hypothetical protein